MLKRQVIASAYCHVSDGGDDSFDDGFDDGDGDDGGDNSEKDGCTTMAPKKTKKGCEKDAKRIEHNAKRTENTLKTIQK